jgi:acyl carrier protein
MGAWEALLWSPLTAAIVTLAITVAVTERRRRHRRRARFDEIQAARPPQPAADFAAACGVPGDIAYRLRRVLAAVSESAYAGPRRPVDPERLRPEDELGAELGYDLDSLSSLELINGLEAEFGVRLRKGDLPPKWPQPLTVREIARVVAARLTADDPT